MTGPSSAAFDESIGQRIRRLRRERSLSQRQLAEPGVTAAYISRIEAGARTPSVKALRVLARKLRVSVEYLETGVELAEAELRELELVEAELELRLAEDAATLTSRFRALLRDAVAAGDPLREARARLGLGLLAERISDHAESVEQLEHVVASDVVSPSSHTDAYTTLARSYAATGTPRRGVQLLERALADVRASDPPEPSAELYLATALRYALADAGEPARARDVIQEALDRAAAFRDPYARIRLHWLRGRHAVEDNDVASAIGSFRRALALLAATDETLQLARAHLAWTELPGDRADTEESRRHLEDAERLLSSSPRPTDLGRLRTQQARVALRRGSADEAAGRAREAIDLVPETTPLPRAQALAVLAEALAQRGDTDAGLDAYERATRSFEEADDLEAAAATARAWAARLRAAGRELDALDVLERAAELATGAGSRRREKL